MIDKTQTPHCRVPDIHSYFGVASSTGQNKSKEVRDLLGMHQFSAEWTVSSKIEQNPLIWMLEVDGLLVDVRYMPLDVQEMAYKKGLIPYVPGSKKT